MVGIFAVVRAATGLRPVHEGIGALRRDLLRHRPRQQQVLSLQADHHDLTIEQRAMLLLGDMDSLDATPPREVERPLRPRVVEPVAPCSFEQVPLLLLPKRLSLPGAAQPWVARYRLAPDT